MTQQEREPRIAVIGAGMSGLLMAMKLRESGRRDVTVFEKADRVGGTWRENRYPGLSCDVPSHLYSYSFELNPDWTHRFSYGPEIQAYFERFADKYGLGECIRFGTEVVEAVYGDKSWRVSTSDGETREFDFLISASGVLHHPHYPEIEGLDTFAGVAFHTARWPDDFDLQGKRVGVIGTGSTSVQLVPRVQEQAAKLSIFQRTAQWIHPASNDPYTDAQKSRLRRFPWLQRLVFHSYSFMFRLISSAVLGNKFMLNRIAKACRQHLDTVRDPELRARLTPDYQAACKRLILASGFYEAVQEDNVELVTEPIARVTPQGVETVDGRLHELDVLVLATGFLAHDFMRPIKMLGEGGATLDDLWHEGPRAYRTVALPGFPNFFMLQGPHSPIGNYPLTDIAERQVHYILACIARWRGGEFDAMSPRADVTADYNRKLRDAFDGTIWLSGCNSWYLDQSGLPSVWPYPYGEFLKQMSAPNWHEYELS